jgi:carbon catabolite-derepressing protein kinase
MEVMAEIYRTLANLGMEWKEKKWLGGLGGLTRPQIDRANERDGAGEVDLRLASAIYFVETRARVQGVVVRTLLIPSRSKTNCSQVLMNLQLYNVDSINYLVDFHHKKSYRASDEPDAGKFDCAKTNPCGSMEPSSPCSASSGKVPGKLEMRSVDRLWMMKDEEVVMSPYIFMDVDFTLILELTGAQ